MIDAYFGIFRFNLWLLMLNLALIVIFFYKWYENYKATGQNIDYWYANLLLQYFVPVLLMYPFGSSALNILTMGPEYYYNMETHYSEAYIITLIGFLGVFIGKYCCDVYYPITAIEIIIRPFAITLGKSFVKIVTNKIISRRFSILYLLTLFGFIIFIYYRGLLGHPREFFQAEARFRPIYHLINFIFVLVFYILSTRVLQYKNLKDKYLFAILIVFGFFLGVRAPLILQLINFSVLYTLYVKKGFMPLKKIGIFILIILIMVLGLGYFRNSSDHQSQFAETPLSFILEIFYGNTFSDIRDFSWILSYWNHEFYLGKSYLAGIMSFIPSALSSFREEWSIGKLTVKMVGFDPSLHPGLRPGMFGESYLNFGIMGVIIFGFIWGYVLRRLDFLTKYYTGKGNVVVANSICIYSSFISYFSITAAFSSLYTHIFMLVALYLICRIRIVPFNKA